MGNSRSNNNKGKGLRKIDFLNAAKVEVGTPIIALVMMREVFQRIAAAFDIGTGIVGILGGFYVFVPSLSIYLIISPVLFGIWITFSGLRMLGLGVSSSRRNYPVVNARL